MFSEVRNDHVTVWPILSPLLHMYRNGVELQPSSLVIIASFLIEKEIVSPLLVGWKFMGH